MSDREKILFFLKLKYGSLHNAWDADGPFTHAESKALVHWYWNLIADK